MTDLAADLNQWLDRLGQAKSREEIFRLVDQFRVLSWSDEQRAKMAKAYMRALEAMAASASQEEAAKTRSQAPDEEVWYEKM